MRTAIRKLGNSSGVIIPKSLFSEIGAAIGDALEINLEDGRIVSVPVKRRPRTGWAEASQEIATAGDDIDAWPEFDDGDGDTLTW